MKLANLVFIVSGMLLTACTEIGGGPIEGRVLDRAGGLPVEGALVIVKWNTDASGLGGSRILCTHIESARTDATGRYSTPVWKVKLGPDENGEQQRWLPFSFPHSIEVEALKPGYLIDQEFKLGSPSNIDLVASKFPGTEAEWFAEWEKRPQFDEGCHGGDSRAALQAKIDVYKKLGHTADHKSYVEFSTQRLSEEDFSKGWITHPDPKPTIQKNQ